MDTVDLACLRLGCRSPRGQLSHRLEAEATCREPNRGPLADLGSSTVYITSHPLSTSTPSVHDDVSMNNESLLENMFFIS